MNARHIVVISLSCAVLITVTLSFHYSYQFSRPSSTVGETSSASALICCSFTSHHLGLQTSWVYSCLRRWMSRVFIGPRLIRKWARKSLITRLAVVTFTVINHTLKSNAVTCRSPHARLQPLQHKMRWDHWDVMLISLALKAASAISNVYSAYGSRFNNREVLIKLSCCIAVRDEQPTQSSSLHDHKTHEQVPFVVTDVPVSAVVNSDKTLSSSNNATLTTVSIGCISRRRQLQTAEGLLTIVVPHVRNALYFLAKSARTLTHFILAINVRNNYVVSSTRSVQQQCKRQQKIFITFVMPEYKMHSIYASIDCTINTLVSGYWLE